MNKITTTKYKFFSWKLFKVHIPANTVYKIRYSTTMPVESTDNQALYTKGYATSVNEQGEVQPPRAAGYYMRDVLDVIQAGCYTYTAQEDIEWWCIAAKYNNDELPNSTIMRLQAGETTDLDVGTKLILCEGTLNLPTGQASAPIPIEITTSTTQATAVTDCYGYLIDRYRE